MPVKRLNYFNHQFLEEQDFKEEQNYHVELRRLHNRVFHSWGVAQGLEVRKRKGSDREITIDPGTAIDAQGREIILTDEVTQDLSEFARDPHVDVTIAYKEEKTDLTTAGGVEGHTRVTELTKIEFERQHSATDGSAVALARVHFNDAGNIHRIDLDASVRKMAATGAATNAGWVRLPFKPARYERVRMGGKLVRPPEKDLSLEGEFIIDVASAYCDEKGARGSMPIPVPPGATKIRAFRISGTTSSSVRVQLFRTGWNPEGRGEKTLLLEERVNDAAFHKLLQVKEESQHLDHECHGVAVLVEAEGVAEICLVAAQFE